MNKEDKINLLQLFECPADGFEEFIEKYWDDTLNPETNVQIYRAWWVGVAKDKYL